jgi:hypothetical protein
VSPQNRRPRTRLVQGTAAELEATQAWWLRWVYLPVMGTVVIAALVVAALPGTDRRTALVAALVVAASTLGGLQRLRAQRAETGRLSFDERDERQTMRTMGYGYCFAYFATLGWIVAWAATHGPGDAPVPVLVLVGLTVCVGLGRLCTRREGL